jgi:hypothetical protein
VLVQRAEVLSASREGRLQHMNVLGIANRRRQCLIHLDNLSRCRQKCKIPGNLVWGKLGTLLKPRVVKDSFEFFQDRAGQNEPVAIFEQLKKESPRGTSGLLVRSHEDGGVERNSHGAGR